MAGIRDEDKRNRDQMESIRGPITPIDLSFSSLSLRNSTGKRNAGQRIALGRTWRPGYGMCS